MLTLGIHCGGVWWPVDCYQAAEESGFDYIWTSEHIVFHRPILDVVPVMAGIALSTKRVRIGCAAIIASLRNPTILAKELTTVDIMSGGRLTVVAGVGGDYPKELEACGVSMRDRGQRMTETLEIMRRYWSGEHFSYHGRIFQLEDVWMQPRPVQPEGPPVWLAGRADAAMERAARLGDGFMPYLYTAMRCREAFDGLRAKAHHLGLSFRPGFTWATHVYVSMQATTERARELAFQDLSWRYGDSFIPYIDKYCIYGTPDDCARQLMEFVDAGVEHLSIAMIHEDSFSTNQAPSLSSSRGILRTIEHYATELVPVLKQAASSRMVPRQERARRP
jgi:probable F420-dependent oxidoreductase